MKQLLIALFTLSATTALAQDPYISGGYATNTPFIKFPYNSNSAIGNVNGSTRLDKISERGYFINAGMMLKMKPTSTFGVRIETGFESYNTTVNSTHFLQISPFDPQQDTAIEQTYRNNYLRLGASITFAKIRTKKLNFQADLGYSQVLNLNAGFNVITPYSNVHLSGGLGYKGILLRAGTEIGLNNMLNFSGTSYKGYAKRYFVGLTVYPKTLFPKKKKTEEQPPQIYDKLESAEPD